MAKYPAANAVDPASELRIISVCDRSFNTIASYESIDVFTLYPHLVEHSSKPPTKVIPLSGNRYMISACPGNYGFYAEGTLAYLIAFILDGEGNLLGRYNLPGDMSFSIQSADLVYGFSMYVSSSFTLAPGFFTGE